MASIDASIITVVLRKPEHLSEIQRAGITSDHFTGELYQKVWNFITRMKRDHGDVPSLSVVQHRFEDFEIDRRAKSRDLLPLIKTIQDRKDFIDTLDAIEQATKHIRRPDDLDDGISYLQSRLNEISLRSGKSSVVDIFSSDVNKRMMKEIKRRKGGSEKGIPTGLHRLDAVTGGLHRRHMSVIVGRPSQGKSWLNLFFVASAVMYGAKVVLYPLEMTLEETAMRLYTIFSSKLMGPNKAIRNLDLHQGRVTKGKIVRLFNTLQDKFEGQLYVADMGSLSDSYTIERIEAEVEMYAPDMFWVDYLTLMKTPGGVDKEYQAVRKLSGGIKNIAMRHNTIGGASAQVNREAIRKTSLLLPRLEHIAYGDSIGQDADTVLSIAKRGENLFYALVKNRHGPEISRVRVNFAVDYGLIQEAEEEEEEDEDD